MVDVVVTEDRVGVYFDPRSPPVDLERAMALAACIEDVGGPREVVISCRYDGPDLADVAAHSGLSERDVARIHASGSYEVVMVGFLPGFAYLRGLDPRLVMPRRPVPRTRVAAGAVAIAAEYTAVYPFSSPGGWNLVGEAVDFDLFDSDTGARLRPGDRVRFQTVDGRH